MRIPILLLSLLLLTSCVGGGGRGGDSGGVELQLLNGHELSDVYFNYATQTQQLPTDVTFGGNGWVPLFDINALLYNRGQSNSLVALYITGFDPNLFAVQALGPYIRNNGVRPCFTDITVAPGHQYSLYKFCEAADDVFVGGGVDLDGGGGIQGVLFNFFNLDAGRIADDVFSWLRDEETTFFQDTGIFQDLTGGCEWRREGQGANNVGSTGGLGFNVGEQLHCSMTWGFPGFLFNRASYGNLLLGLYGEGVRSCQNGCTSVPSPVLPEKYLAGNTEEFPGGQGMYVDHRVWLNTQRWPSNLNDHTQLFQISACYLYTTYLTPIVCIDPTPATSEGDACRPGSVPLTATQSAPIHVTAIEQKSQGPKVAFTIHVQDVGSGRPFSPGAVDYCSPASASSRSRQYIDVVEVLDARVLGSLDAMDCKGEDIRLRNGAGSITCFHDLPFNLQSTGAYQTTIVIEIGYLYRNIQTVTANIHRT